MLGRVVSIDIQSCAYLFKCSLFQDSEETIHIAEINDTSYNMHTTVGGPIWHGCLNCKADYPITSFHVLVHKLPTHNSTYHKVLSSSTPHEPALEQTFYASMHESI